MPSEAAAREPLSVAEQERARAIQGAIGAGKRCLGRCGRWLPVMAFSAYGASACRECEGLLPWLG